MGHPQDLPDAPRRKPKLVEPPDLPLVELLAGPMADLPLGLGPLPSRLHPLPYDLPLELRERRKDVKKKPPVRGGGVEVIPDGDEVHPKAPKLVDGGDEVFYGPPPAVEFCHRDGLDPPLPGPLHGPVPGRPVREGGKSGVAEDLQKLVPLKLAEPADLVLLLLEGAGLHLVLRGHPGVAEDLHPWWTIG